MNATDASQPSRSIAPSRSPAAAPFRCQTAIVAVEDGRLEVAVLAELGDRVDRRVEPLRRLGDDLVHRLERRPDEPRDRFPLRVDRRRRGDQARPRQRGDVVDVEDDDVLAGQLELDRLVVREAGRDVDGSLATAAP